MSEFVQRPQRVLLTNMYGGIGGGEVCIRHHIRHLRSLGSNVTLLLFEGGPFEGEARKAGADVLVKPFAWRQNKLLSLFSIARQITLCWNTLRKHRSDVVCCYTFNDYIFVGLAARLAGVPVVWRTQGEVAPESANTKDHWLGDLLPAVCRIIRPYIASTTRAEANALATLGLGAKAIECVYLGTPILREGPPPTRREPRIGLFGRLVAWKGQDIFLRALVELKRRGRKFEAWIVGGSSFGDGDAYEASLREFIALECMDESVRLLGFREDVNDLMSQCDIVCHCSTSEPFGMVIIEAMMLGRPVVATRTRGPSEIIENGRSGVLVPPSEPLKLADALDALFLNEARRAEIGKHARRRALRMFSLDDSMRNLDHILDRARDDCA